MLLSAVSVLVVAQSSSEIPEGLMNNPVYIQKQPFVGIFSASNCQCSLFSKENPIIRIFYASGWLAVPINPDKWNYSVRAIKSTQ